MGLAEEEAIDPPLCESVLGSDDRSAEICSYVAGDENEVIRER